MSGSRHLRGDDKLLGPGAGGCPYPVATNFGMLCWTPAGLAPTNPMKTWRIKTVAVRC